MTKEEQILSSTLRERLRQCENRGIATHTGFLSPAEVVFAESVCRGEGAVLPGPAAAGCTRCLLDGGYEDAERRICIFIPWDRDEPGLAEEIPSRFLSVLRVNLPKGAKALSHRDYLGALLGLGVERSVIGDILVRGDSSGEAKGPGADIIVLASIAGFLSGNLSSVGRAVVSTEVLGLKYLDTGSLHTEDFRDTVASLRLDSIAASAFRLARGKAQEAVRQGLVSVNGRQVLKPDRELCEADRISFRGKGKAVLTEVGGRTRKDRIAVVITRYL